MDNVEYGVIKIPDIKDEDRPPTRECGICGELEDPKSKMVYNFSWICPECAKKLYSLIHSNCEKCGHWSTGIAYDTVGRCKLDGAVRRSDWYCAGFKNKEKENWLYKEEK